ncbi:MAG TPA: HAD-IIA family hydrolase [Ktedonobacteraceae bacterium]|nr:HAD-IIA family hydrolase [Ktedonobacteraceae bacterium]
MKETSEDPRIVAANRCYDAYIFDLDGTIYLGDALLPGAQRLIIELRNRKRIVRFISNNPTKTPEQYAEKLTRLGLPTAVEDITNTVVSMTRWLLAHYPDAVVFPISEQPLIDALADAGIRMSHNPAEIDIVIASYDRSFSYEKLQIAFDAIWFYKRARLIATNPDRYCPMPGGRGEPDAAAITAAIEACTNTKCEVVVGKPDPVMVQAALTGTNVQPENCVVVGDRLSTDIRMAHDAGMDAALVPTGETKMTDLQHISPCDAPRFVLDRIDRLLPPDLWQELGWR